MRTLRDYIALIEASQATKVSVDVDGYKNAETIASCDPALPNRFVFEFGVAMGDEDVTQAIRSEIHRSTGFEPTKFRWRRMPV